MRVTETPSSGAPGMRRGRPALAVDPLEADVIRNGIECGMSNTEISRELGISRTTVRQRAAKIGIDARRGHIPKVATLRHAIQDMNKTEAIEYLLEVAEQLTGQDERVKQTIGGVKLRPQQAIIFALLNRYIGQDVSRDRILMAITAGRPDAGPDRKSVGQQIYHMRKRLAGQYVIHNVFGYGYRMEVACQRSPGQVIPDSAR